MKRILYVTAGKLEGSGIDAVCRLQIEALRSAGHEVHLVSRSPDFPADRRTVVGRGPWGLLSWLPNRYYSSALKRRADALAAPRVRSHPPDLVVTWSKQALRTLDTARDLGIPGVLNCGNLHCDAYPAAEPRRWPAFSRWELRTEYELARLVLATSERARLSFVEYGIPAGKTAAIARGIDTQRFHPPEKREHSPFRLLFCGRLSERKGIRPLLETWKQASLPGAELWLVGDLPRELDSLRKEYPEPSIRWWGFQDDVAPLMRQCHAQISLSRDEGMAKSLLEGAACGLATLATHATGFPMRDGENGWAIRPDDTAGTAVLLRELAGHPAEVARRGLAGSADIQKDYSESSFQARFLEALAPWL